MLNTVLKLQHIGKASFHTVTLNKCQVHDGTHRFMTNAIAIYYITVLKMVHVLSSVLVEHSELLIQLDTSIIAIPLGNNFPIANFHQWADMTSFLSCGIGQTHMSSPTSF